MKWTPEYKREVKEKIRSILVRKPNASKYELSKILKIDHMTALKLKKKVHEENTKRIEKQRVNKEVGKIEVEYNALALECWQVITNDIRKIKVKKKDEAGQVIELDEEVFIDTRTKLVAVKTLVDLKKRLFDIKFDAGIFRRKLGELALHKKLSDEEEALIRDAINLDYGKPTIQSDQKQTTGG